MEALSYFEPSSEASISAQKLQDLLIQTIDLYEDSVKFKSNREAIITVKQKPNYEDWVKYIWYDGGQYLLKIKSKKLDQEKC